MTERGGGSGPAPGAPARVAVLVSGSGTNLQSLLDRFDADDAAVARVVRVIADRPGIRALERASSAGVDARVVEDAGPGGERLLDQLENAGADLVVLAGYLRLVPAPVVRAYRGRMINIHPALLPAFGGEGMYGRRVHEAVLASGARVTGVTVHFVNEEYDAGSIIAQWPVPVREGDGPGELAERVLAVEHRLLPRTVAALARGDVELEGGRTRWRRPWFEGDRFELADGEDG